MKIKSRVTIAYGYSDAVFDFDNAQEASEFAYLATLHASIDNRYGINVKVEFIDEDKEKDGEENA